MKFFDAIKKSTELIVVAFFGGLIGGIISVYLNQPANTFWDMIAVFVFVGLCILVLAFGYWWYSYVRENTEKKKGE